MFLISDDLHSLISKELEYIPIIILLREFENFIDVLWDRLPEHIRADSEVQRYQLWRMSSRGLLNRVINALPFELYIPEYQFCGPGTRLEKRRDLTLGERAAATAVWVAMKTKTKLGMGLKTRKRKSKRILPIAKRGGALPILPLLGVLGSLVGGAARVAKVVNDSKAAQHQLKELQRHNRVMEGRGVYLSPYKRGRGIARRKKNVDETLKLPKGVTTNVQLQQLANRMRIPYFRGIFMRTTGGRSTSKRERYRKFG
ncbi:hypothetical protein ALC60_13931 [Trachymyrmex zeteki]|uniref:Uncharacterized protein n=1 Tax=Mycetomoellerius zeteki TaxID=64791 RepID=A0A151WGU7_9HYME|nr:hypothetical protein ALC60_13931 [Trachymyrmex zeteki]